jgi:uncharacterized protein YukE
MQQSMEEDQKMSSMPADIAKMANPSDSLLQSQRKDAEAQAAAAAAYQLTADKIAYAHGQMSAYAVAVDEAKQHTLEYAAQLTSLQSEFGSLDPSDSVKRQTVQTQINEVNAKQQLQAMQDAQNAFAQTWKGSITSIYDTVIQKANQTAQEVARISEQFIDGINDQLVKGMFGQKTSFSKVFEGASQSLAKTGLQKVEGSVLGSFGKKDGSSQQNALWVQLANNGGGPNFPHIATGLPVNGPNGQSLNIATQAASSGLLGMMNNSNFFSSLFGGRLFGAGGLFGGHFASGGDVMGGVPIDVGELGPERFVPHTSGHIIPNNQLPKSGPSVNIGHISGSDPVQTKQMVYQGMMMAHAQSVHDATHAVAQRQRRVPH